MLPPEFEVPCLVVAMLQSAMLGCRARSTMLAYLMKCHTCLTLLGIRLNRVYTTGQIKHKRKMQLCFQGLHSSEWKVGSDKYHLVTASLAATEPAASANCSVMASMSAAWAASMRFS